MNQTDGRTFDRIASPYDRGMAPLERLGLGRLRARLVPHARGKVLEIGVGTGAPRHNGVDSVRVRRFADNASPACFLQRPLLSLAIAAKFMGSAFFCNRVSNA